MGMRAFLREMATSWRDPLEAEVLGPGVLRFRDPMYARFHRVPFPGYERQPDVTGVTTADWRPRVRFATRGDAYVVRVEVGAGADLYGTGEVAGPLRRNGRVTTCWNFDAYGYDDATPHLYQSHPWVLALNPDGSCVGVLVETTHRCEIDLTRGATFRAKGLSPAAVVISGDDAATVLERLASLVGRMPLPPLWALGYHQCRYSYEPDARVREVAQEFRARNMPCDCIWMDIDYMDGFRCFTFDRVKFPDPAKLNADLHAMGFHATWMIDPGIKAERGNAPYDSGRAGGHFLTDRAGNEVRGKVWPGECAFPDFTRGETRRWWAELYGDFLARGVDGVWNDMNEPAVFDVPTKTLPEETPHRADADLGGPGTHARYHNVYGMLMARASREGMLAARPERRPFLLTRAGFIGSHRYAATWTGDNTSDWRHLAWSIPMVLNLGLSGQPFAGPDIGGFRGNATGPMFARWMGIGALLPFARAHSEKGTEPHEPWSFGPECERVCRVALERRYRLLPYLYTAFDCASRTGLPVARPAWWADAREKRLRGVDDAFVLGNDIYVRASVEPGGAKRAPEPPRGWARFEPVESLPELPELWARPGAIIPLAPVGPHTGAAVWPELTLIVNPHRGAAAGELYEDAGEGLAFLQGEFRRRRAMLGTDGQRIEWEWIEGELSAPEPAVGVVLVRDER